MQKPPASAGSGLQSSQVWEWGVLGVTLGWREPEPGPSTARWNQPGQALGTAVAASATPVPGSPGTSRTYPIRGRAPLTPLVLCSRTPPPTGKQPVSEQVRHWSGLITGFSNTAKELLQIFCSPCQNRNTPPAPLFSFSLTSLPERNQSFALSNALESHRGSYRCVHGLYHHKYWLSFILRCCFLALHMESNF